MCGCEQRVATGTMGQALSIWNIFEPSFVVVVIEMEAGNVFIYFYTNADNIMARIDKLKCLFQKKLIKKYKKCCNF